ncbi:uncharacterized protein LOC143028162 [Oratosquilla oratoria]|uniref:uncharacterized protein LOC143028162 n=1 Tax=Oratosquilla oratoria TaxID=337810 RepID=UPI003F75DDA5
MNVSVPKCLLLWAALVCAARHCHGHSANTGIRRRGVSEGYFSEIGGRRHATEGVGVHGNHDLLDSEVVLHAADQRPSMVSENGASRGAVPPPPKHFNRTEDRSSSTDVSAGLAESPSGSVNINKQNDTKATADSVRHTTESVVSTNIGRTEINGEGERKFATEEDAPVGDTTSEPSDSTDLFGDVTEVNNVAEQDAVTEEEDAAEEETTGEPSEGTKDSTDVYPTMLQQDGTTEEEREELEAVKVEKGTAKKGCKRTCYRKCCPIDYVYDKDSHTCKLAQRGSFVHTNLVVGLPACSKNFTIVSEQATDGKSRLKLGSYSVKHEYYCSDIILVDGKGANESLLCDDKIEDAKIVNIIRKTSIIGNIVSALGITFIYVCHIFIPKLNEKQGCLFICFCTAVFAKALFEAPGRAVKYTAYPNYGICVFNSVCLMFARASVPVWLSVLTIHIARQANSMGNFFRMMQASSSSKRRGVCVYIAYGLGLTFLQWLLALLLTNFLRHTQRQSVIYDRTCLFTDRSIRNYVFLYPSIGLMAVCLLLMVYTHRYRKVWCQATIVQGSRTVHVDVQEKPYGGEEEQPRSSGDSDGGKRSPEDPAPTAHQEIFRAHSGIDFVAVFWQQVGLVFFWVLLTTLMLLVQLTGRGVLSHITYLMDSFQGLYVLIIFLYNQKKRGLILGKLEQMYHSVMKKIHFKDSFSHQTGLTGKYSRKKTSAHKNGDPFSSASTLELARYPSNRQILSEEASEGCPTNRMMHLSAPLGVSVCSGLSQMTEVPYIDDSSRETSPGVEEGPMSIQQVLPPPPPSDRPLHQGTSVDKEAPRSLEGRPLSDEASSISRAISGAVALDMPQSGTPGTQSESSTTYESDSPQTSDTPETFHDPEISQSPESSTSPGVASLPTPPASPETPTHQDLTPAEALLKSEIRTSTTTPLVPEANGDTPYRGSTAFPEISEPDNVTFKRHPTPESLITPETSPSVSLPSSKTPSINESTPDPEITELISGASEVPPMDSEIFVSSKVPSLETLPLPQRISPEVPSLETSDPFQIRLSEISPVPGDSRPPKSSPSEIPGPLSTFHFPARLKDPSFHQAPPQNSPSHEVFPNPRGSSEEQVTAEVCEDAVPPLEKISSKCRRSQRSSEGLPAFGPLVQVLDGAVETESTWL